MSKKRSRNLLTAKVSDTQISMISIINGVPDSVMIEPFDPKRDDISQTLSKLSSGTGVRLKELRICIPQKNVFYIDSIEVDPMTEEALLTNLPYEFHEYVGDVRIFDYEYDYSVKKENRTYTGAIESYEISAIAIEKRFLHDITNGAKKAHLRLTQVVPEAECFVNLIKDARENGRSKESVFCFAEVGTSSTNIIICSENGLIFSREIEMGIPTEYKPGHGMGFYGTDLRAELALEIERTVRKCETDNNSLNIQGIYLLGEGCLNKGFIDNVCDRMTDKKVRYISDLFDETVNDELCCRYAVLFCLGLAEEV